MSLALVLALPIMTSAPFRAANLAIIVPLAEIAGVLAALRKKLLPTTLVLVGTNLRAVMAPVLSTENPEDMKALPLIVAPDKSIPFVVVGVFSVPISEV